MAHTLDFEKITPLRSRAEDGVQPAVSLLGNNPSCAAVTEQLDDLVLLHFRGRRNLDFELFGNFDEFGFGFLSELRRRLHRRNLYLWQLVVIHRRVRAKVMAASRPAPASSALLLTHVVGTMIDVGTMFGLQKNVSL